MSIADHCLRNTHCRRTIKIFFLTIYFLLLLLFCQKNIIGFYGDRFTIFIFIDIISISICGKWWWPLVVNAPWSICLESKRVVPRIEKVDIIRIVIGLNRIGASGFAIYI